MTAEWTGWSYTSEDWEISNVKALTNENRTPIVFNIACLNHYLLDDCLGEAFMNKYPGGAVASLGATAPSFTIPNHDYDKELFRQFTLNKSYKIGWIGNVAAAHIIDIHGTYGRYNAQMYLWLGDPATEVWTDIPGNVSVDYPSTIPFGQSIVQVTVESNSTPIQGAQVCLMQPNGCYASGYTNATGVVELKVDVQESDDATLTVSAHDHLPFIAQIQIGDNFPPFPPTIDGPVNGTHGTEYNYTFVTMDPDGDNVSYKVDWGDGNSSNWVGPYPSGENITISHIWSAPGKYAIKAKANDTYGQESNWSDPFNISMINNPPNKPGHPSPGNGSTNVSIVVNLIWDCSDPDPGDKVTFDVYFGTTTPPPKVASNVTEYNPVLLDFLTILYPSFFIMLEIYQNISRSW